MQITREPLHLDADFYSADYNVRRSLGCHLMQVVDYMEARRYRNQPDEVREAQFFGGYLWEHAMAQHAIDVECARNPLAVQRVGQLMWCYQCDTVIWGRDDSEEHLKLRRHVGIFATPDALLVPVWELDEWKFTKKSLREGGADRVCHDDGAWGDDHEKYTRLTDGKLWRWTVQTPSYVWLIGDGMRRANLKVNFVNGDYNLTTFDTTTVRYRLRFTGQELEGNWSNVINNALEGELLKAA